MCFFWPRENLSFPPGPLQTLITGNLVSSRMDARVSVTLLTGLLSLRATSSSSMSSLKNSRRIDHIVCRLYCHCDSLPNGTVNLYIQYVTLPSALSSVYLYLILLHSLFLPFSFQVIQASYSQYHLNVILIYSHL